MKHIPHWVWLVLIAAPLRLAGLGSESLWYDETFTAWLARLDLPAMFNAIKGDVHPPLWYIIEWLTVRVFGYSEFSLRLPSALLGIVAVLLVWRLALAVGVERRTALIAGVLAAIMPMALYYSQEARMYNLLSCLILVAAWAAIRERWLIFALASIGALYTQNLAVFYIAAIGIVALLSSLRSSRTVLRLVAAGVGIGGAWGLWLPTFLKQASAVKSSFWMPPLTFGSAIWVLPSMTMGIRIADILQIHVYGLAFGLSIIGLIVCRRWLLTRPGLIVLAVIIGAPAIAALISVTWRAVFLPRALLPSSYALMLIWAYALTHLSIPNRQVAQAVTIPVLAIGLFAHYFPAFPRVDIPSWAAPINSQWQPGDVIFFTSIDSTIVMTYYLRDHPYALLPEATDLNQSLTPETKAAMGMNEQPFDDLARSHRRIWLVHSQNPLTSRTESTEFERIMTEYRPVLVKRQESNQYAYQAIYLVNLNESARH